MKPEFIEVIIDTSDIINNVDEHFEDSYTWSYFLFSEIDESNIDYLKGLIPANKQKFLKLEYIRDIFENDVTRIHEGCYVASMESKLVNLIHDYIQDTIGDNLPLDYVSMNGYFEGQENPTEKLTFTDYIIVKFKRADVIKFQRSRNYWDRINYTFDEIVLEEILNSKRKFTYDNLDASYNWDSYDNLKQYWNDYSETISMIDDIIQKRKDKLKTLIKNHVSLFKRNEIIEAII